MLERLRNRHEERNARPPSGSPQERVGLGMARSDILEPTPLHTAFRGKSLSPQKDFFRTGKTDQRGVTHFELKNRGRKATRKLFAGLEQNLEGLSVQEKASAINQIGFSYLNDQQNETVRRSLRAHLMVTEARKLEPESKSWTSTVQKAREDARVEGETKISAFEALDRELERAEREQEKMLVQLVGKERADSVRKKWNMFIGKVTLRDVPTDRKKRFVVSLGLRSAVAITTILALNEVYEASYNKGKNVSEAVNDRPHPITSPVPKEVAEQISQVEPTRVWSPDGSVVFESSMRAVQPASEARVPDEADEQETTIGPTRQPEEEVMIAQVVEPEKLEPADPEPDETPTPHPTEKPAPTEVPPSELTLTVGETYTFTHSAFTFSVNLVDFPGFNDEHRNGQEAYAIGQRLITSHPYDQQTTINLHSGQFIVGEDLPGSILVKAANDGILEEGDVLVLTDKEGNEVGLKYTGVQETADAEDFGENALTQHEKAMEIASEDRSEDSNENTVAVLTCDTESEDAYGNFGKSTVLVFTPVRISDLDVAEEIDSDAIAH